MANYMYYPAYNPITGQHSSFGGETVEAAMKAAKEKGYVLKDINRSTGVDVYTNNRRDGSTVYSSWYYGRRGW